MLGLGSHQIMGAMKLFLWCACGILAAVAGCVPVASDAVPVETAAAVPAAPSLDSARVRVVVTRDFGTSTLLDEMVSLPEPASAMAVLQRVAEVGTAYGGSFVQSIEGLEASRAAGTDWFYCINGVLANRGASDVMVSEGDVEHWDYRAWGSGRNVSATLACYPAFLLRGYRGVVLPTVVAHESQYQDEAVSIAASLRRDGVTDVRVEQIADVTSSARADCNLVVVAGLEEQLVRDVLERWDRLGLFARLDGAVLRVSSAAGEVVDEYDEATGLLQPLQNPWNPAGSGACENVLLLVTGTDAAGVRLAAKALVDAGDSMDTWCGAVTREGGMRPQALPVVE